MKYIFLLIVAFFLSCNQGKEPKITKNLKVTEKKNEQVKNDSSLMGIDSIIIKDHKFYVKCLDTDYWKDKKNPDCNLIIQNERRDTIFKNEGFSNCFELKDFNQDGYTDIEIHYHTNVPGIYDMMLYDKETNNFLKVSNFDSFPASSKIKGTNYYYSYHRSGCADSNWDSDLFYIKDYKCYRIGNISGRGCEAKGKTGIYINKVVADEEVQIKFIKREEGYYEDKWEFIENYWTKNYKKFIK